MENARANGQLMVIVLIGTQSTVDNVLNLVQNLNIQIDNLW